MAEIPALSDTHYDRQTTLQSDHYPLGHALRQMDRQADSTMVGTLAGRRLKCLHLHPKSLMSHMDIVRLQT